jgi:RNA polymerase sigma factor (sigma-70 family)
MAADPQTIGTHYGAVYRFVRKRSRSREDAEDLTQDVFLAAIVALDEARLRETEPSLAWLYTVARRRLVDRLRRNATRTAAALRPPATGEPTYSEPVVSALVASLNELDPAQRRVIVMKLFEGRRFSEIAETLASSDDACRARFSRGLAELRERLRERGVDP